MGVMELIIRFLVRGIASYKGKEIPAAAAARRDQKRQEALLLQYVLESEERDKRDVPDVLKLPEFMVNRERRNKHAY